MDDLISRDYVLAEYDRQHNGPPGGARKIMEQAPAVDAAPVVHAYWIHCNGKSHIWYCSNCGEKINYNNAHKTYAKSVKPIEEVNRYCRGCGAKMDGDKRLAFADQSGADYADNPTV